ncbi:MAG: hypothetical protein O3B47_03730 [bacterium]|nr:hypothetical protein [bacterium]
MKWQELDHAKEGVKNNQALLLDLREKESDEKSIYESKKAAFDQQNKEIEQRIATVFPVSDEYTALTRQIDQYEKELASKSKAFEVSNLDFQNPLVMTDYSILPVRMNIRSSSDNFTKFLHLMENSGSLDDNVRLMDISSIRLNFENSDGKTKVENINFSVQINAYFQNT